MYSEELVIVFKQTVRNNKFVLIPVDCVSGIYDEDTKVFIDDNEYVYSHFSALIPGRCFGMKQDIHDVQKKWTNFTLKEIKNNIFKYFKKGDFEVNYGNDAVKLLFKPDGEKEFYEVEEVKPEVYNHLDKEEMYEEDYTESESDVNSETEEDDNIELNNIEFNAKEIRNKIKETVIGQDKAIDKIVTTIWRNLKIKDGGYAKNILVSGPTGSGKTLIFRTLAKIADIPMVEVDANSYTAAGYIGGNIEDMLFKLIIASKGDLRKASQGIIVIDEFDKLAGTGRNDEVSTTKVQDALLKMVEGNNYRVTYDGSVYELDTAGITFVGAGSFARVSKSKPRTLGFNSNLNANETKLVDEEVIDFGFEPEILGRFPVRVALQKLEVKDLTRIILESNKSAFTEEVSFLKDIGINTVFDDEVIEQIAKKAYQTGNGARGISRIITDIFEEIMTKVSDEEEIYHELELKNGICDDNKRYVLKK